MRALHLMMIGVAALGLAARDASAACTNTAAVEAARTAAESACTAEGNGCANAPNHGQYVKCIAQKVNADASLPKECRGAAKKCAAKSTCGKAGFVTCCRTKPRSDGSTATKCSIKRDADHCKPPKGGTACAGAQSSCCDACDDDGCVGGSPSGAFVQ
jgi:hypothetical protein